MRGLRSQLNLIEDSDLGIIDKKEINSMAEIVKSNKKNSSKKFVSNKPKKEKTYGSDREGGITPPAIHAGLFEYKMPRAMAEMIIKSTKKKVDPQVLLCDYVNTFFGLKGYCVKVIVN